MASPINPENDPSVVQSRSQQLLKQLKERQNVARKQLDLMFAQQQQQGAAQAGIESHQSKVESVRRKQIEQLAKEQEAARGEGPADASPPEIPLQRGRGGGAFQALAQFGTTPDVQSAGGPQPAGGGNAMTGMLGGTGGQAANAAGQAGLNQVLNQQGPGVDQTTTTVPAQPLGGWEQAGALILGALNKDFNTLRSGVLGEIPGYTTTTQHGPESDELIEEMSGLQMELMDLQAQGGSNPELQATNDQLFQQYPELGLRARAQAQVKYQRVQEARAMGAMELNNRLAASGVTGPEVGEAMRAYVSGDQVTAMNTLSPALDRLAAINRRTAESQLRGAELAQQIAGQNLEQEKLTTWLYQYEVDQFKKREGLLSNGQKASQLYDNDWNKGFYGYSQWEKPMSSRSGGGLGSGLGGGVGGIPGLGGQMVQSPEEMRQATNTINDNLAAARAGMVDRKTGDVTGLTKSSYDNYRRQQFMTDPAHPIEIMERSPDDEDKMVTRSVDGTEAAFHLMLLNGVVEGNPLGERAIDFSGTVNPDTLYRLYKESAQVLSQDMGLFDVTVEEGKDGGLPTAHVAPRRSAGDQWLLDNGNVLGFYNTVIQGLFIQRGKTVGVNPAMAMANAQVAEQFAGVGTYGPEERLPDTEARVQDYLSLTRGARVGEPAAATAGPARPKTVSEDILDRFHRQERAKEQPPTSMRARQPGLHDFPTSTATPEAALLELSGGPQLDNPLPYGRPFPGGGPRDVVTGPIKGRPKALQPKVGSRSELIRGEGRPVPEFREMSPWLAATLGYAPIIQSEPGLDTGGIPRRPKPPAKTPGVPSWLQPWVGRETLEEEVRKPPSRRRPLPDMNRYYYYTSPTRRGGRPSGGRRPAR